MRIWLRIQWHCWAKSEARHGLVSDVELESRIGPARNTRGGVDHLEPLSVGIVRVGLTEAGFGFVGTFGDGLDSPIRKPPTVMKSHHVGMKGMGSHDAQKNCFHCDWSERDMLSSIDFSPWFSFLLIPGSPSTTPSTPNALALTGRTTEARPSLELYSTMQSGRAA